MPHNHQLGRKKAFAVTKKKRVEAARKRRKAKAIRLAKLEAKNAA